MQHMMGKIMNCKQCGEFFKGKQGKKFCDTCGKDAHKRHYRKIKAERPWEIVLKLIRTRCNNKNYITKSYQENGIQCELSKEDIKQLWEKCGAKAMEKPSVHRIDNFGNYNKKNCVFIESSQHTSIHHKGRIYPNRHKNLGKYILEKPISQFTLDGKYIKTFSGQCKAAKSLGLNYHTSINKCLMGKTKTGNGYIWKFVK